MRFVLVLITVAFFALVLAGMWWGWRNRLRRQDFTGPVEPAFLGETVLGPEPGVYVGSAFAESWQDRVAALGVRAAVEVALFPEGLRLGAALFVPAEALLGARLAPGLAGKVVGRGGLLVVRWRHEASGDRAVDSGVRFDDKTVYPAWVRMINERVSL